MFVNGSTSLNSDGKTGSLSSKDAKSIRKELQEIRNRINFLLDSLDSGDMNDRYGVSAMADALQEKTSGLGAASQNSLDPSDSTSNTGRDNLPTTNGPFQGNNISSENSKEFDPFNTAQKPSNNISAQPPQRIPDDQASVASHSSSSAARPEPEMSSNSGGGFQRPDVTSIPPNTVGMPQQPQPGAYQGAYNPTGYPMPQQQINQQIGAPNQQAGTAHQQIGAPPTVPPSTNVQSSPQVGQQPSVPSTGYNPYPPQQQQQPGYQHPGAMPPQSQGQAAGPAQVPPSNQPMYQQQYQQQGYPAGAQPTQTGPPRGPPGPPIGPPQTMTAQGANPYGMPPRGQSPLTRYPQAPAYR